MFRILDHARIPLFLHKESNHIFTVLQHIVLLALRQYENKSYRMFVEWEMESYYLRIFMKLSHIPHYTTLQKFACCENKWYIIEDNFLIHILLLNINRLLIGIDSSGFKTTNASQYKHHSQNTKEIRKIIS
jgi:hypothetical protein